MRGRLPIFAALAAGALAAPAPSAAAAAASAAAAPSADAPASAAAAAPLTRCATAPHDRTLCAQVGVPLDRSGAVPGTISLRVKALPPAAGGAAGAPVLAIAGGPGQAAVPLLDAFATVLRPLLRTRELVVFDQRGTGGSGRLRCAALASGRGTLASVIGRCATELGARRTAYTTAASVQDVEAVRAALGVDKLILYSASYGTKVALAYAAAYPQHVERLVLDSVVLPEGIDPFQRSTLASIPRVLREVCGADCRFTHDPGADLAALARRMAHGGLRGKALDGRGRLHRVHLSEAELLGLLLSGDFDRFLRAGLPAAVRGALDGDAAPLLRLAVHSGSGDLSAGSDSDAVYIATTCEDGQVPWAPGTPLAQRRAAVDAASAALPTSAFLPFDRAAVRTLGTADLCRGWPESPILQPAPPLPATPTLILSGDDDLRTPRADALALAGRLPGAQLLEVPDAGHGVLFSDPGDCAQRALLAFAGGVVPSACRHRAAVVPAMPLAPARLAALHRARGVAGLPGRTVAATVLTLDDATAQLIQQLASSGSAQRFGGLRAGSAALQRGRGLRLRGYGYVPGVIVSGAIPARGSRFTMTVGGRAAAHGNLTFSRRGIVGVLDGVPVHVPARALGTPAVRSAALATLAAAGRDAAFDAPSPLRPPVPGTGLSSPVGR
jgi:pimeloyl-ACP methyl ester carboxylesterase